MNNSPTNNSTKNNEPESLIIDDILGWNLPTDVFAHLLPFLSTQELVRIQCIKKGNKNTNDYRYTISMLCPNPPSVGDLCLYEGTKLYLKNESKIFNDDNPSHRVDVDEMTIQYFKDRIIAINGTGKPKLDPLDISTLPNLIYLNVKELAFFKKVFCNWHMTILLVLPPSVQVLLINKLYNYQDTLKRSTVNNRNQLKFLHIDRLPNDFLVYDALLHYPNLRVLSVGFIQSNPEHSDILTEQDLLTEQEYKTIDEIWASFILDAPEHVPTGLLHNNEFIMTSRSLDLLIVHGNYFCESRDYFVKAHTKSRIVIIKRYEFWHPYQIYLLFSPVTYPGKEKIQLWLRYDALTNCITSIFQSYIDKPTLKHIHVQVAVKNQNVQLQISSVVPTLLEMIKTGLASNSNCIYTFVITFHGNERRSHVYAQTVFHNTSIWICDAENANVPVINEDKEIKEATSLEY